MVQVLRSVYEGIIAHAVEERSQECCGLLGGTNGVITHQYRGVNVAANTDVRYEMDGAEIMHILQEIEAANLDHLGIYHSHPKSRAYPSATDRKLAAYDVVYFIVSLASARQPHVGAFRIHKSSPGDEDGVVSEEPIEIVAG